jgi:hypothetical protein
MHHSGSGGDDDAALDADATAAKASEMAKEGAVVHRTLAHCMTTILLSCA